MFKYRKSSQGEVATSTSPPSEGFGFQDIPVAMWRHKWLFVLLPLIFAGLTAVYAQRLADRYSARAQILIDPRELRVLTTDVSPNSFSSDSIASYIESQARVLTSMDMLRRIADREKLAQDSEYSGAGSLLARLFPSGRSGDQSVYIAEQLRRNISVRRGERTFIIDVDVTASTPDKAARLANAFASAYLEDQSNVRADTARRASTLLTSRLNELRERVRASENKIEAYKVQTNLVGASGRLVTEEQLAAVNSQLAFARSRLSDARAKLEQIDSLRGQVTERGALPEAVNSQTIGILRQQLGEAQRRVSSLSTSLGPMHPEYLSAQSALRDAQRSVGEEIGRIRQAARNEADRAAANERGLIQQVETLKRETLSTSRDTVQLRELERELEANRGIYQSFLARARETSEQERFDTTNARIMSTAVPPVERAGPQRRVMVMLALAAGLAAAMLLSLLLEIRSRGFRFRSVPSRQPAEVAERVTVQPRMTQTTSSAAAYAGPASAPQTASPAIDMAEVQATDDLMRLLKVLGRLEKAMSQTGMSR
jgi:uncharacterized protein involved in exopolysaccharide biosynthesis